MGFGASKQRLGVACIEGERASACGQGLVRAFELEQRCRAVEVKREAHFDTMRGHVRAHSFESIAVAHERCLEVVLLEELVALVLLAVAGRHEGHALARRFPPLHPGERGEVSPLPARKRREARDRLEYGSVSALILMADWRELCVLAVLAVLLVAPVGVPASARLSCQPGTYPAAIPGGIHTEENRAVRREILQLRGGAPSRAGSSSQTSEKPKASRTPARPPARQSTTRPAQDHHEHHEKASKTDIAPRGRKRRLSRDGGKGNDETGGAAPAKSFKDAVAPAHSQGTERPEPARAGEPEAEKALQGESKQSRLETVSREYFLGSLPVEQENADDTSSERDQRVTRDDFRHGAAEGSDSPSSSEASQEEPQGAQDRRQETMGPANRSAFVPVIYDDVDHRAPVRERDEWLELFRSMDTYSNIIDLPLIQNILEGTGVECVDRSTLKFTGFLVDACIARVCNYAADYVRLRLEREEELKERAARMANKMSTFKRADVRKRMRTLNYTLLESDILHALNELMPDGDLPFLPPAEGAVSSLEKPPESASAPASSSETESESSRRYAPGLAGDGDGDEGSYIDPAAALEMARFGLSRKQTAALDEALKKEKEAKENGALPAQPAAPAGGEMAGLQWLVNDADEDEKDYGRGRGHDATTAPPRGSGAAQLPKKQNGEGGAEGDDAAQDSDGVAGEQLGSSQQELDAVLDGDFSHVSTSESESEAGGYFVVRPPEDVAREDGNPDAATRQGPNADGRAGGDVQPPPAAQMSAPPSHRPQHYYPQQYAQSGQSYPSSWLRRPVVASGNIPVASQAPEPSQFTAYQQPPRQTNTYARYPPAVATHPLSTPGAAHGYVGPGAGAGVMLPASQQNDAVAAYRGYGGYGGAQVTGTDSGGAGGGNAPPSAAPRVYAGAPYASYPPRTVASTAHMASFPTSQPQAPGTVCLCGPAIFKSLVL